MDGGGVDRWEKARREVVGRWRMIVERIDAHDEGGVLELANVMDEFCDEAIVQREAAAPPAAGPERVFKTPAVSGLVGTRCLFCRGFSELGGCLGMLNEVNLAVLGGRWQEARRCAERYIARLESLDLTF